MIEVLYRAMTIRSRKMVYGFPIEIDGQMYMYIAGSENHRMIRIDPETLGQYIGRKDRNGKKVFAGDILKEYPPNKYVYTTCTGPFQILYYDCSFQYSERRSGKYSRPIDDCEDGIEIDICEVLGNIHENPELLEELYEN